MSAGAELVDAAFADVLAAGVAADGGTAWRDDDALADHLYSGTAGVLLAAAEAVTAGLEGDAVRAVAAGARDRLVRLAQTGDAGGLDDDSLFFGWAGIAVALRAWAAVAEDGGAADAGAAVTSALSERVIRGDVAPDEYTDIISGRAGVLLGLVTGSPGGPDLEAAAIVADRLVAEAEVSAHGPQWRMVPDYPILMPNFSHGTAGVAYALLVAAPVLARPDLVDMAVRGAETLLALEGGGGPRWTLPMTLPRQAHRPEVSYGWCHGPTGTVQLFELLARMDPSDPRWPETVARCIDAVVTSGLPARLYPGFWDNLGRCCGTAGVGSMVLDRYQATGDATLLAFHDRLVDDVVARALPTAAGVTWSHTEHTVTPPELPPKPGFMQGTAGIAAWLARAATVRALPVSGAG